MYRTLRLRQFLIANKGNLPQSINAEMAAKLAGMKAPEFQNGSRSSQAVELLEFMQTAVIQAVEDPRLVMTEAEEQSDPENLLWIALMEESELAELFTLAMDLGDAEAEAAANFPAEPQPDVVAVPDSEDVELPPEPDAGLDAVEAAGD